MVFKRRAAVSYLRFINLQMSPCRTLCFLSCYVFTKGDPCSRLTRPAASTECPPIPPPSPHRAPLPPFREKVVIRRLPHQMKEEEFLTALVAAAADAGMGERGGSWDLMYFTPGKMSKKRGRVSVFLAKYIFTKVV